MKFTRRHILFAIIVIYMALQGISASRIYTESYLLAALQRRAGEVLPPTVCYPVTQSEDEYGYLESLYAIAPTILMPPGGPCDAYLTP